jgi:hypothetical protein
VAKPARAAAQARAQGPARAQALAQMPAQARAAEKTVERVATKVATEVAMKVMTEVAMMVLSTPKAVRLEGTTADEAVRTAERKRKTAAVMTAWMTAMAIQVVMVWVE